MADFACIGPLVSRIRRLIDDDGGSRSGSGFALATGLTTIVAACVQLVGSSAPALGTSVLTALINGTSLDVYAWKPTSAIDCTLIASTGTETFYGVAIGT